jgi:RNA polymerase sigma factor (sigma-70 family)
MEILNFAPLVHKYTRGKSEDIKSEAWLAVVEAFADYDPAQGVPLPGYVESRVKYAVLNLCKKEQRQKQRELYIEDSKVKRGERFIETLPDCADVAGMIENQWLGNELYQELGKLSFKQQQSIIKTIVYGYSLTELAHEWGVTPQAVFNLRKSGLGRLKKRLAGMYISEGRYTG